MSIPQVTFEWLLLATMGCVLAIASPARVLAIARYLRGWFWTVVILLGERASVPLSFFSLLFGLIAALPICSTIFLPGTPTSTQSLSGTQSILLGLTLIARFILCPALAIDWSLVRRWEQEVVRRPRARRLFYLRFCKPKIPLPHRQRASGLGVQLAENDLKESASFRAIPQQSFGLLLLYFASIKFNAFETPHVQNQFQLFVFAVCIFVFVQTVLEKSDIGLNRATWFFVCLGVLALVLLSEPRIMSWLPAQSFSHATIPSMTRFPLVSTVALLFSRDLAGLLESQPRFGVDIGFAPVDKKYSFLKKATKTVQWLVKPRHLVFLLMQLDILQSTLKLTLIW